MDGESMEKLISDEDVDSLSYMAWSVPDNWQEKVTQKILNEQS